MSGSRPKLLFLVHRSVYPPNRGDRIRSFHILDFLSRRAEVALGFLSDQEPSAETVDQLHRRCVWWAWAPWGRWRRWMRAAWSFARGRTATEGLFASASLRQKLQDWLRHHRPDAVLVFCSSMVQYLDVPGLEQVRTVVDLVDVDSQKWFDYAHLARGWKRWTYQQEGRRLRRLEQWIGRRASAVVVVGPHEAELYRRIAPGADVYAVLNGVDLEYFRPIQDAGTMPSETAPPGGSRTSLSGSRTPLSDSQTPPSGSRTCCVFVGALDYQANIDGIEWFCREVWPEVLRHRPEAQCNLVGSNPSGVVRQLAQTPGVRLVGPVPDVRPYLAEAQVVIVPLRVARGIQNKVLEGLAMGKAVLASPQALEGLTALQPGVEVLSADRPATWVETLLELWADPERRAQVGAAGRAYVERHHRWEETLRPLARVLGLPENEPTDLPDDDMKKCFPSRHPLQ